VVSFTHSERGTTERSWEIADGWGLVGPLDLDGIERVLVLAAHPDDETLGAGGLVATAVGLGLPVRIVVATDGEASHPDSPTHLPSQLAAIRRSEAHKAAQLLGIGRQLRPMGLPDGSLGDHAADLREFLDGMLDELGGQGTLVVAPWHSDGHPDHEAAGFAARDAAAAAGARLIEYPIWMWHWAEPNAPEVPWGQMRRLELSGRTQFSKHVATLAHRSQIEPLSDQPGDEALLDSSIRAHFARGFEVFIEGDPVLAPPAQRSQVGRASLGRRFFDDFYADAPDPWGYDTRWYEERKRAVTLAALPRQQFSKALEVGCSIGVLSAELATRCDEVIGVDISEIPLREARRRLGDREAIEFVRAELPDEWPEGEFDLVVLSEVGYYWDTAHLAVAIDRAIESLTSNGVLLACHWRHPVEEYVLSGDAVHAALAAAPGLVRTVHHLEEDFVLDVYARPPGDSVARQTGLL